MHLCLKAIGFNDITGIKKLNELLEDTAVNATSQTVSSYEENDHFCEIKKEYGQSMGISLYGELDDQDRVLPHGYFPYFEGSEVSSIAEVSVEKRMEDERYLGMCEDERIGVSLVFTVINGIEYTKNERLTPGNIYGKVRPVIFSGMAVEGTILFPVQKKEGEYEQEQTAFLERKKLIAAARNGDQEAIETLTFGDMDQYYEAAKRLENEDVFSIIETFFMPYGIEGDVYSIMGEILAVRKRENEMTKKEIWQMKLTVNGLHLDICVPADGLTGEPEIGRRFKGIIWLQGIVIN